MCKVVVRSGDDADKWEYMKREELVMIVRIGVEGGDGCSEELRVVTLAWLHYFLVQFLARCKTGSHLLSVRYTSDVHIDQSGFNSFLQTTPGHRDDTERRLFSGTVERNHTDFNWLTSTA